VADLRNRVATRTAWDSNSKKEKTKRSKKETTPTLWPESKDCNRYPGGVIRLNGEKEQLFKEVTRKSICMKMEKRIKKRHESRNVGGCGARPMETLWGKRKSPNVESKQATPIQ